MPCGPRCPSSAGAAADRSAPASGSPTSSSVAVRLRLAAPGRSCCSCGSASSGRSPAASTARRASSPSASPPTVTRRARARPTAARPGQPGPQRLDARRDRRDRRADGLEALTSSRVSCPSRPEPGSARRAARHNDHGPQRGDPRSAVRHRRAARLAATACTGMMRHPADDVQSGSAPRCASSAVPPQSERHAAASRGDGDAPGLERYSAAR